MKLVIFDIDGTLTQTNLIDRICFEQAFENLFAIKIDYTDWNLPTWATDAAFTSELFQKYFGRLHTEKELTSLQNHFIHLLKQSYQKNPEYFREVPGASRMLSSLRKESDWATAIATGCWRVSGELKLKLAGLEAHNIPAAFADEAYKKEDILEIVFTRVKNYYPNIRFDKVVYVGDKKWDAEAAKCLGFGFVGIQNEEDEWPWREEGVTGILRDFLDYNMFIHTLESTGTPE